MFARLILALMFVAPTAFGSNIDQLYSKLKRLPRDGTPYKRVKLIVRELVKEDFKNTPKYFKQQFPNWRIPQLPKSLKEQRLFSNRFFMILKHGKNISISSLATSKTIRC
jgi:hypothetical protein